MCATSEASLFCASSHTDLACGPCAVPAMSLWWLVDPMVAGRPGGGKAGTKGIACRVSLAFLAAVPAVAVAGPIAARACCSPHRGLLFSNPGLHLRRRYPWRLEGSFQSVYGLGSSSSRCLLLLHLGEKGGNGVDFATQFQRLLDLHN